MSKRAIRETLEAVPIDRVILGAPSAGTLTPKQRKFAEAVAMGETKTGAYRQSYDTQAKGSVQAVEAQRLVNNPKVALQIQAFKTAAEAKRYATPAALRNLVIERLTATAIDDAIAPAQRLRALELLGKVTEVAAFTERREVVTVTDSGSLRERLLETLRNAITTDARVMQRLRAAQAVDAEDAGGGDGSANAHDGDAPGGEEAGSTVCLPPPMLSNPDVMSCQNNIVNKNPDLRSHQNNIVTPHQNPSPIENKSPTKNSSINNVKKHNIVNVDEVEDVNIVKKSNIVNDGVQKTETIESVNIVKKHNIVNNDLQKIEGVQNLDTLNIVKKHNNVNDDD
jgi:hypothetical protein